jgi:hypothetical protein
VARLLLSGGGSRNGWFEIEPGVENVHVDSAPRPIDMVVLSLARRGTPLRAIAFQTGLAPAEARAALARAMRLVSPARAAEAAV